nr:C4-type zinc ribbon domain-containing protein [Maliibacterium massiliense]
MDTTKQLEKLWQYQQVDLEIDGIMAQVKATPLRQKLVRTYNYLKEQQQVVVRMEAELTETRRRLDLVLQECRASDEALAAWNEDDLPEMSREELVKMRQQAASWADTMGKREKELARLAAALSERQKQLDEMRVKLARAKRDYPLLKEQYDGEVAKAEQQTAPLRAKRDTMAKNVDPALLKRYLNIKGRRPNPVAKVVSDQCSGCNMSIAALVLRNVRTSGAIVECENCGRILYVTD